MGSVVEVGSSIAGLGDATPFVCCKTAYVGEVEVGRSVMRLDATLLVCCDSKTSTRFSSS